MRAGELSVEAMAQACLDRIAARDPLIEAWTCIDPDVLSRARAMDRARPSGPLHGLPVGVKDVILTRAMPTRYNSPIHSAARPTFDAACVTILKAAGALILGKTHTVEFAATGRKPPTRNPHDLGRTPGASSSGSAAAVADRHVPVALGTQTGGSMIRPAAYCGVFAIKPTWNFVSLQGVRTYSSTLDTLGWFGRSAEDLALLYEVFDPNAEASPAFLLGGSRIAVCRTPAWDQAEPATAAALAMAVSRLREWGVQVSDLTLPTPFERLPDLQMLIMKAEGQGAFLAEYRVHYDQLDDSLRKQVENAEGFSRKDLLDAYDTAARCRPLFDDIASEYDAILAPSAAGEAPFGLQFTGPLVFNGLWTLLHTPCVNVPGLVGPNGLPVGMTITGPRFSDRRLLAVAQAVGNVFAAPQRLDGSG